MISVLCNRFSFHKKSVHMKKILLLSALVLFSGCSEKSYDANEDHTRGTFLRSMEIDGETREYLIHIPQSYDTIDPVPLMLNFHGWEMKASEQMWVSDMRALANTEKFIVVYPQGTELMGSTHWNVGSWTAGSTVNDLYFVDSLIGQVSAHYNIDADRVYACGYSNGGFFSHELACQLSHEIAAIGTVAANMSVQTLNNCNPTRPVPVVTISGTMDELVKYDGSEPAVTISHRQTLDHWIAQNHVDREPALTNVPNTNTSDGSSVILFQYVNGEDNVEIEHYRVVGGGHGWPGKFGNMDMDANSVIWDFVSQFDLNGKR
jgi:polyhydroxybutyrate depolymerase